jgi:TPP-dependent trihydroxycyclohexane-1,2-dione (THcHDO) dehydratase
MRWSVGEVRGIGGALRHNNSTLPQAKAAKAQAIVTLVQALARARSW